LIERVDVAVPAEFDQEVIPIKYALASDIANALNSLSSGGGGTTVGRTTGGGTRGGGGFGGSSGFGRPGGTGTSGGYGYPGQTTPGGVNPSTNPQATTTPAGGGSSFSDRLQNIIRRASNTGEIQILGQT